METRTASKRGPLRVVAYAELRQVRSSFLGPDTYRRLWMWELRLECGHIVERRVRFRGESLRRFGGHRTHEASEAIEPTQARCPECGAV